jgi:hypothetical protein
MQLTNTKHNPSFAGGVDSDLSLLSGYHFPGHTVPRPAAGACLLHAHSMGVYQPSPTQVKVAQLYIHMFSVKAIILVN